MAKQTAAQRAAKIHTEGPGLKVLSTQRWYGGGYCAICGTRGDELVARSVRFWDPDDGWKVGVLCHGCGEDAAARGPRPDDYAVQTANEADRMNRADNIEISAAVDLDSTYSDFGQPS